MLSVAENWNSRVVEFVIEGGAKVIDESGGVRSTSQVHVAGVPSLFPAESTALTRKICGPSESPFTSNGLEHVENPEPSTSHSNPTTSASGDENWNANDVDDVTDGGHAETDVSGGVVSIVKDTATATEVFPALSIALTSNVCGPSAKVDVNGEVHVTHPPPST